MSHASPKPDCTIHINGRPAPVSRTQTVAAALAQHAGAQTSCAPDGSLRAPLCGMGVCQECRVEIDGRPHQLACQTLCADGMQVRNAQATHSALASSAAPAGQTATAQPLPQRHYDVVVIGAGPGGQMAAATAARALLARGGTVALLDDNPHPGGQIWRGALQEASSRHTLAQASWAALQEMPNLDWYPACKVTLAQAGAPGQPHRLLAQGSAQAAHTPDQAARLTAGQEIDIRCNQLILANGARERLLPFPGWTLNGVMGLGGLQALAKGGWPLAGKRVVLAGSGPLLLAVAATLRAKGAHVLLVAEQAGKRALAGFAGGLLATPDKLWQAAQLGLPLLGRWRSNSHVLAALPATDSADNDGPRLGAVRLQIGARTQEIACDYLACGFGLQPNTRLAQSLDCRVQDGAVWVDTLQQTSRAGIWCIGEACGVGGVDKARIEGEIAGWAACGEVRQASSACLQNARARWQGFAARLAHAFALQPALLQLAQDDTIVCRCESVRWDALAQQADWKSAKMQTRCGMGACQGLICGSALAALQGWDTEGDLRAPLAPCRVGALAGYQKNRPPHSGRDPQSESAARFSSATCQHPATAR